MAIGKSNKEIARILRIAEGTVKVHITAVFRMMGVHNRVSAAAILLNWPIGTAVPGAFIPGLFGVESDRRGHDEFGLNGSRPAMRASETFCPFHRALLRKGTDSPLIVEDDAGALRVIQPIFDKITGASLRHPFAAYTQSNRPYVLPKCLMVIYLLTIVIGRRTNSTRNEKSLLIVPGKSRLNASDAVLLMPASRGRNHG